MTDEQIIEREFRKAVHDQASHIHVELDKDAEEIKVWYRSAVYTCDCDSDEEFIFARQGGNDCAVSFPIPDDWHPERFQ